jgi:molecular chaperone DnaK
MAHPAIGIDLGTTYSGLAAINPAGKPEIIASATGERITASAVFFEQDGPIHIGQPAADAAGAYPDRVVQWIKREMGNPEWRFGIDGNSYTAVDVSALILKKIKKDAEIVLGPLRYAVITVPAYFDEVRRKATMDAAKKAGLEVLRIINEPTAAALAHASTGKANGTVLVYDFGGGTFDVSVVDIEDSKTISVLASEGDHQLGGHDLEKLLASHFDELFHAEKGVRLLDGTDEAIKHRVFAEAERTKRTLSSMPKRDGIPLNWGNHWINASVTLDKFEQLIADYLVRTEMLVEDALSQAGKTASDIASVILVGGSTRIPAIRKMLQEKFGQPPLKTINPDEAVALGAALQAGILMEEKGLSNLPSKASQSLRSMSLRDVTNHSYGTLAVGESYGRESIRNSIIIPKNTPIPCSRTESFCTRIKGQTEIDCSITQGEGDDPDFVNKISDGSLELPPDRPAGCEIRVTYSYDANQRMSCEFLDVDSGRSKKLDLDVAQRSQHSKRNKVDIDEADLEDLVIE